MDACGLLEHRFLLTKRRRLDAVRKFRRILVALRFVYARFARAQCCARCKFGSDHLQGVSVATVVDRGGRWV